jgi:hypothetical protein
VTFLRSSVRSPSFLFFFAVISVGDVRCTNKLHRVDNHYKMDLTPKKEAIKVMIQDELTKMSEEADEDEDTNEDTGKKQQQPQAKEVEA